MTYLFCPIFGIIALEFVRKITIKRIGGRLLMKKKTKIEKKKDNYINFIKKEKNV